MLPPGIKGLNILNMLQLPKEMQFTLEKANFSQALVVEKILKQEKALLKVSMEMSTNPEESVDFNRTMMELFAKMFGVNYFRKKLNHRCSTRF